MSSTAVDNVIVAEITIKASAERLFEALTNPEQRIKWWGLKGRFETTEMESDLRVGGRWAMRGNGMGGKSFNVVGEYRIVERPRVLAFTWLPDWDEEATETLVRFGAPHAFGLQDRSLARPAPGVATNSVLVARLRRKLKGIAAEGITPPCADAGYAREHAHAHGCGSRRGRGYARRRPADRPRGRAARRARK
jgi:uncharacterized protein YndB with AHSA1/START domain